MHHLRHVCLKYCAGLLLRALYQNTKYDHDLKLCSCTLHQTEHVHTHAPCKRTAHCTSTNLILDCCSHMSQAGGNPTNCPVLGSNPTCHSCLKPVGAEISLISAKSPLSGFTSKLAFEPRFRLKKFMTVFLRATYLVIVAMVTRSWQNASINMQQQHPSQITCDEGRQLEQ